MGLIFLAAQDVNVGESTIDVSSIQVAKRVMGEAKAKGVNIHLPVDGYAAGTMDAASAELVKLGGSQKVPAGLSVFDIGPETLQSWSAALSKAKTVVWNGPMGVFEKKPFSSGTYGMVDFLLAHKQSIRAVTGGGETVAAISDRGALSELFHVSTGGGAMLEFLEGQELPGFEILKLREREVVSIQNYLAGAQ
jgi:phosphoglycerate kinase